MHSVLQVWTDYRLTWDPNDYDQINFIAVEHHEIWYPDIMAYNKYVQMSNKNVTCMVNYVLHDT